MQNSDVQDVMSQAVSEAFLQHGKGPQADAEVYRREWPYRLENYLGPIDIYHGSEDLILPWQMSEDLARHLTREQSAGAQRLGPVKFQKVLGEGHFSLSMNRIVDILNPN